MAATAASRKTHSIHDYPEHLNPFYEDDNHNKIRFWTLGRRLTRSNSINFSGIKDLKNSWAFRSFMRKGKKGHQDNKYTQEKSSNHVNGDTSPIMFRRAMHNSSTSTAGARSTVGSPDSSGRYVYGGSVTPLPRSRFQERLRSPSQFEVNSLSPTPRMARSEVSGSRLSMESTNPFDDEPVPPVRASRRKKKRAPPPPPTATVAADVSVSSGTSEIQIKENNDKIQNNNDTDLDLEEMNMSIELKIIEEKDVNEINAPIETMTNTDATEQNKEVTKAMLDSSQEEQSKEDHKLVTNENDVKDTERAVECPLKSTASEEDILNSVNFQKIDIMKYRRNSSVNEDDIRLRRGNLEDFHALSSKRSKSLTNALDTTYSSYDINLNEHLPDKDTNGNDEPQKVVCKVYDETARKHSVDTVSSTEKEFLEIDKATRELEREISKLNSALNEEDLLPTVERLSVSEIKRRFDNNDLSSPNPIPKPRRSHYGGSSSP